MNYTHEEQVFKKDHNEMNRQEIIEELEAFGIEEDLTTFTTDELKNELSGHRQQTEEYKAAKAARIEREKNEKQNEQRSEWNAMNQEEKDFWIAKHKKFGWPLKPWMI